MRWVVVGAGSAGCVVAGRLAEAGEQVVLVEAGAGAVAEESRGPDFFAAIEAPGRTFPGPYLRGRGVGGSGAINGMIATPGDLEQYRSWGWDDTEVALGRVRVPVEQPAEDELGPVDRALLGAAPDAVRAPLTRRDGRRVTAFDAYVTPAVELRAEASVTRVLFDADRATGVELADGQRIAADAVVVCAGAVGSPMLLRASGIDNPQVGADLRDHAAVQLDLRLSVPASHERLAIGALLHRDGLQLLAVNHPVPVLLVVALEDPAQLAVGASMAHELLEHRGFGAMEAVGTRSGGAYHATSTCRMGDVVDDDGAVIGRRRLFVVDASIFPDLPTTNPYLPTLMLAERMVSRILSRASQ